MSEFSAIPTSSPRPRVREISTFRRFDFSTFPPKNHPKREPPQHTPATRLASEKNRVCHYMSPSDLHDLRASRAPIRAARVSKRYQKSRIPDRTQRQPPTPTVSSPLHFPGPSQMPPRPRPAQTLPHFDDPTFRFFDFSRPCPNTCPPQELQTKKIGCVTLCHLGVCRSSHETAPRISRAAVATSLAEITA